MKKILVIEDAQSLRKDILEMLGFEGYDALGAENGLIGIQRAREINPDLIICDIMMPEMDGYSVLDTLRSDAKMATTPFIFLTARTDRNDVRQGMDLGADDFLTKPFTAPELLKTVSARLEKRAVFYDASQRKMDSLRGNIVRALPHEFRTPLHVVLGFSDLLMNDDGSLERVRVTEMARHIHSAGQRLHHLVENFLVYTQTELALTDAEQREALQRGYTPYPREAIIQYAGQRAEFWKRAGDLVCDIDETDMLAMSDVTLKKIVEEVVDNAFKFSIAGTLVSVKGNTIHDRYQLTIRDQGRGMSREQIEAIGAVMQFERRLYEQQGAGLGLVICKRLIGFHGGDFIVRSAVGSGTEIRMTVPLGETQTLNTNSKLQERA